MRLIKAQEINAYCKKVSTGKYGASALLLLYKDSRYDMAVLDEEYGPCGWSVDYKEIKGCLYCTISVWDGQHSQWVSKTSNGTESNMEAQKGEASDALKRAGFLWGIGRELYTAPQIYVSLNPNELDGNKLRFGVDFHVAEIGYDDARNINRLVIADGNNNVRWSWPKDAPKKQEAPQKIMEAPQQVSGISVQTYKKLIHFFGFDDAERDGEKSAKALADSKNWMVQNFGQVIIPTKFTNEMVEKVESFINHK